MRRSQVRADKPDTDATALYMQGTYTPPILDERIAVTLGYRHTEEKKAIQYLYLDDGTSTGTGLFSGSLATITVNMNYTGALQPASTYGDKFDQQFHNDSGTVTVAYQLNDDTSAFVRWAQGYRSGGYNGTVYENPFKEETIDQWEFGVKSDLVPGTLRLNASIFQYAVRRPAGEPDPYCQRRADDAPHQRRQGRSLGRRGRSAVVSPRQPARRTQLYAHERQLR